MGGKLPPAAAARCLRLASWEALEQPAAGAHSSGEALQRLRVCCLDVAACGSGGSRSLAAAAADLASLAASEGSPGGQLGLAPELLLRSLAAGQQQQQQQHLTLWSLPGDTLPAACGRSLPALLQLLGSVALSDDQRGPLLLAAARAAAAGGNGGAALRLLASTEAELAAGGSDSSTRAAAEQLLRLGELQAAASGAGSDTATRALELLLAARGSTGGAACAVVPAAAQLLLAAEQPQPCMTAAEAAGLMQACELPGLSRASLSSTAQLEQLLLAHHQQPSGSSLPAGLQYALLKAAVAAAPDAAQQWWQWAAWLHSLAQQPQQQPQQQAAAASVAFTASCRALALAGGSCDSYAALPALLAVLQLLVEHSAGRLPADAAAQLTASPAAAWLPLLPQLLEQVAGGVLEPAAQQALLTLLLHVGQAAPSQVLPPALVAAAGGDGQHAAPAAPLRRLLLELHQAHPVLAQQLQTLAAEAARLAVLPEEHWHAVLQEAAATAAKRLQAQRRAAAPLAADGPGDEQQPSDAGPAAEAAGADAYLAAMGPVLLPLQQQLQAADAAPMQTPHERRFQQQALPALRQLLQQLLEPLAVGGSSQAGAPASDAACKQQVQRAISLLRAAAADLAASVRRKQLALPEVAPGLAALADSGIAIPGVGAGAAGAPIGLAAATLAGVDADVAVLSTKTRPKRLRFLGSDGRRHAFLLKVGTPAALPCSAGGGGVVPACPHACCRDPMPR